jgi:hypothetical protein
MRGSRWRRRINSIESNNFLVTRNRHEVRGEASIGGEIPFPGSRSKGKKESVVNMEESKMHSGIRMLRGVYIATKMTSRCHLGIVFRILDVLQGKGKIFVKIPSEASDKDDRIGIVN